MSLRRTPSLSAVSVACLLGDSTFPSGIDSQAVAVRWGGHQRTYAELRSRAQRLAAGLSALDIGREARVSLHSRNRGEAFEIYFACAIGGWTYVPTNFRYRARDLADVYAVTAPSVVFTEAGLEPVVREALERTGRASTHVVVMDDDQSGADFDAIAATEGTVPDVPPAEVHMVLFSSGTTGKAKGVTFRHEHILNFAWQQVALWPGFRNEMVTVIVPPLFNAAGINDLAIASLMVGGTVAIHPSGGWSPKGLADHIDRVSGTHVLLFPTMLNQLLEWHTREPVELGTLELALIGGEHCPPSVLERMEQAWPDLRLIYTYGLTEGGLVTFADALELTDRPGSVGRIAPGARVAILSAEGVRLPQGEAGEVATASSCASTGYWREPGESMVFVDGWVRTGDIGILDEAGHLHIVGRKKDMIISKGQNVFPAEIESVLVTHPGVATCAVLGIPDAEFGEVICAVVVRRTGSDVSGDDLAAYVASEIAPYKQPRRIEFVDTLPMSDNNKVLKRVLLEQLTG